MRLAGSEGETAAVESATRAFVAALGDFDYRTPGYTARLAALSSGELRAALGAAALDPAALAQSRVTTTEIERVSVSSLATGRRAAARGARAR